MKADVADLKASLMGLLLVMLNVIGTVGANAAAVLTRRVTVGRLPR